MLTQLALCIARSLAPFDPSNAPVINACMHVERTSFSLAQNRAVSEGNMT